MNKFGVDEETEAYATAKDAETRLSEEVEEVLSGDDIYYESDHDEDRKEKAAYAYFREEVDRSKTGGLQGTYGTFDEYVVADKSERNSNTKKALALPSALTSKLN